MLNSNDELLTGLEEPKVKPEPFFLPVARPGARSRQPVADAESTTHDDWGGGSDVKPVYLPGRPPIIPRGR
jgi:hypothetical protein